MGGTQWMYVLLVLVTLPPMVPNSAILTSAGALAVSGSLSLPFMVVVVLGSMVLGDLAVFSLARFSRRWTLAWLTRPARRRALVERVVHATHRHGLPGLLGVRFMPAGRGLGALAMGVIGFPRRRYLAIAALAEALFTFYTLGFGYLAGQFLTSGVATLLIGPALSLLIAGAMLTARGLRRVARGNGGSRSARPPEREARGLLATAPCG